MILKKWMPVLGKDHAQTNNLERDDDSKRNHPALGTQIRPRHPDETSAVDIAAELAGRIDDRNGP
jgi:hypothetical protein